MSGFSYDGNPAGRVAILLGPNREAGHEHGVGVPAAVQWLIAGGVPPRT